MKDNSPVELYLCFSQPPVQRVREMLGAFRMSAHAVEPPPSCRKFNHALLLQSLYAEYGGCVTHEELVRPDGSLELTDEQRRHLNGYVIIISELRAAGEVALLYSSQHETIRASSLPTRRVNEAVTEQMLLLMPRECVVVFVASPGYQPASQTRGRNRRR